jgi:hypothetical protein
MIALRMNVNRFLVIVFERIDLENVKRYFAFEIKQPITVPAIKTTCLPIFYRWTTSQDWLEDITN